MVSERWFPSLTTTFMCRRTAEQPPCGWSAMYFGQTDLVKLVLHLPPSSMRMRQGSTELASMWGPLAMVGPADYLLGPPG
jgi:hypothetical protein